MKKSAALILASVLVTGTLQADTVVEAVPDSVAGKSLGGFSGFMAGAAAGGPVGAAIGAGLGWLVGGETHKSSGLGAPAYRVRRADGSETVVRSPKRRWLPGDRVRIVDSRLVAEPGAGGASQAVSFNSER
jgi:outer membrane lipoprotein SlyB